MATVFSVRAHPGARRLCLTLVSQSPLALKADLPEPPEEGRANRLLLSELEKALACQVVMLAGHKSRRKTLSADCQPERVIEAMKQNERKTR
ncbi:MAG: DUF167 domain-containing protein [Candidatus Micrarchaeia archaeon]